MKLQKQLDLRETYRTYKSAICHSGKGIELHIAPEAVEKFHERKNRSKYKD
ncbi:MAG: hypothetical protein RR768_05685 [Clostridium sp.]